MNLSDLKVETYILDLWGDGAIDVQLTNRHSIDGSDHWAIIEKGCCLNKEGLWGWEPIPSSRDDAFFARCRWDTAQEALDFYVERRVKSRFEQYRQLTVPTRLTRNGA